MHNYSKYERWFTALYNEINMLEILSRGLALEITVLFSYASFPANGQLEVGEVRLPVVD
ncbi:MAG: hypothetical protein ACI831_001769 [Candidatus Azotimanducaceae bacterium]|jgi:hypothetical protein